MTKKSLKFGICDLGFLTPYTLLYAPCANFLKQGEVTYGQD
jgi:hypothetical protein